MGQNDPLSGFIQKSVWQFFVPPSPTPTHSGQEWTGLTGPTFLSHMPHMGARFVFLIFSLASQVMLTKWGSGTTTQEKEGGGRQAAPVYSLATPRPVSLSEPLLQPTPACRRPSLFRNFSPHIESCLRSNFPSCFDIPPFKVAWRPWLIPDANSSVKVALCWIILYKPLRSLAVPGPRDVSARSQVQPHSSL